MYLYKIGYGSYEESCFVSFTHEKRFTHDELTKIIGEATVKAIKKQKTQEHHTVHNFQDVFKDYKDNDVIHILQSDYGFVAIEYDEFWSCFGWPSIFVKKDWGSDRDENLDAITDAVLAAGFTREDDDHFARTERSAKKFKDWMHTVYCSDCEEKDTCAPFKEGGADHSDCSMNAILSKEYYEWDKTH